jgi:tetratricopeptide (TPR) repeat protein
MKEKIIKFFNMSASTFGNMLAVLAAVVTAFVAVIALVQHDANIMSANAGRDVKYYTLKVFGSDIYGYARSYYDDNMARRTYDELGRRATAADYFQDGAAATRFRTMQEDVRGLTEYLQPPYFDTESGQTDYNQYLVDINLRDYYRYIEIYAAASEVQDGWDTKSQAYSVQVTILAVSLFLLGIASTVSEKRSRWVFAFAALFLAGIAIFTSTGTFLTPVKDLRDCRLADNRTAIDAYVEGRALVYQSKYEEAVAQYTQALQCEPHYVNALERRAYAYDMLEQYDKSEKDYLAALDAGADDPNLLVNLGWVYYEMGRFDDSVERGRAALKRQDRAYIRFNIAVALLAAGRIDEARAEYDDGMRVAARQVAEAKANGTEPPSYIWWDLETSAAGDLSDLIQTIDGGGPGYPPPNTIANKDAVRAMAEEYEKKIKSLSVGLEFTGLPPKALLTARLTPLKFATPIYDENRQVTDYQYSDTFRQIDAIFVGFEYQGIKPGQMVLWKVYRDGQEIYQWRLYSAWSEQASGEFYQLWSQYNSTYYLDPGEYTFEVYIDSQLAQRGTMTIEP